MHYATINGIGSRIFCLVAKAMLVAPRRITGCSWRPFFSDNPTPTSAELQAVSSDVPPGTTPPDKIPSSALPREPRIREFLDTCFVMMPFGSWFDRYYQDIYTPAIKEAGFEPVR